MKMNDEILLEDLLADLSTSGVDISKLKVTEEQQQFEESKQMLCDCCGKPIEGFYSGLPLCDDCGDSICYGIGMDDEDD